MKKFLMIATAVLFCSTMVMAKDAKKKEGGKEGAKAKTETIVGTVEVKKDAAGVVTEINILVKKDDKTTPMAVVLDAKKDDLVKLDGKEVEVKAVKGDDGKLTVKTVAEKKADAAKAPEAPKADAPKADAPKADAPAAE